MKRRDFCKGLAVTLAAGALAPAAALQQVGAATALVGRADHIRDAFAKLGFTEVQLQAQQVVIPMLAVGLCFELQPDTVQLVADFVLSTITVKGQLSGMLKTVMCHFQENYITVLESYDPADHGMEPYTRREEL